MHAIKKEYIFLVFLILLAAFMRFFRFSEFMIFLDDQGRDALIVKRMLINRDLTLLGPRTSVGNMYLGPLYYYAMVPFLALTYPSPVGPAYGIAVLGVLTTALIYLLGKKIVGVTAASIAALLFAITPVSVELARFSWQPNPAPFFGLLMLYAVYQAYTVKKFWWIVVAICFAVLSQLHYVALLSGVPAFLLFCIQIKKSIQDKTFRIKQYLAIVLISFAIFMASIIPLIAFDILHNSIVTNGFRGFIQDRMRQPKQSLSKQTVLLWGDVRATSFRLLFEPFGLSKDIQIEYKDLLLCMLLVLYVVTLKQVKQKKSREIGIGLGVWIGMAILGLALYRNTIYAHYYAYLFPAVFLVIGFIFSQLMRKKNIVRVVVYLFIAIISVYYIVFSPFLGKIPVMGVRHIEEVSRGINASLVKGDRYNIALLNDNREYMGMKYRYFLETMEKPPQSEYTYTNLDKLVIIVENKEDPLASPIFEIAQFIRESNGDPVLLKTEEYVEGRVKVYIFTRRS